MDGVCEHAGDVVPPRVSVDGAAGFVVAVLLGPGVEEVADLPRRVAGAASVHFEDEREGARVMVEEPLPSVRFAYSGWRQSASAAR